MRVVLFHNTTEPDHWFGYQPGHSLRKVFEMFLPEAPTDRDPCEYAWIIGNIDEDDPTLAETERLLVLAYRSNRIRSMSIGDVVLVDNPRLADNDPHWYAAAWVGWDEIAAPVA